MEYIATVQYTPSSDTHVITYKGEIKDFPFKRFAPYLIYIFGKKGIFVSGKANPILLPLASISLLLLLFIFLIRHGFPEWIFFIIIGFMFPFMVLMLKLGNQLSNIAIYYRDSRCEKCGQSFSCEEARKPDIEETSTPDYCSIQITRYWKCRSCAYENIRKRSEGFVTQKGTKMSVSSLAKIPCKKCGKTGAYVEYKKPDVKEMNIDIVGKTMIRRYYRCKLCGYEDIQASDEHHYGGEYPHVSEWRITYEDLP